MRFKVSKIIKETHDTSTIRFDLGGHCFEFTPGQFVIIEPEINGLKTRRSYSVASSPTKKGYFEITVKKIKGGQVSNWVNDKLRVGDEIEVKGPFGRVFLLDEKAKEIVFIAAGSGIVPFMSMMRYISDKNLPIKVTLLDSNKTPEDIIYRKELEKLGKKFKIVHTITRPETSKEKWNGRIGRIDIEMIKDIVGNFKGKIFYLCGSKIFAESMRQILMDADVDKMHIRREIFG